MAAYVLASKDTKELETTVFSSEGGDAVAVFTDLKNAQQYIDDANWQDEMTAAELNEIQLLEWLIMCHRNGVKLMATDPRRSEQEAGLKVDILNIQAQLEHAGQHIAMIANPDF